MVTVTKKDLVALGYGNSFATDIIRLAKIRMVEKGYPFYSSRKLDRVPAEAEKSAAAWNSPYKPVPPLFPAVCIVS